MAYSEDFLEESQAGLTEILRPFRQRLNRRARLVDFVQQCVRAAGRDDFFQLDELLNSRTAQDVEKEAGLKPCQEIFEQLRAYANEKVDRYRVEFIEELRARAEEAGLPMEIHFPRFEVLKGIDGEVSFGDRRTEINKKTLKSVDPRRIVSAALKLKRQLYDRPYDPQGFIDGLFKVYGEVAAKEGKSVGDPVPMQAFYLAYVLSLQSRTFYQDMDKGKFRGYSLDQFAVDLWRYFEAETGGTSGGYALQLRSGRNNALWLIDSDGERRQFSTISFQEQGQ